MPTASRTSADMPSTIHKHLSGPSCSLHQGGCILDVSLAFLTLAQQPRTFLSELGQGEGGHSGSSYRLTGRGGLGKPSSQPLGSWDAAPAGAARRVEGLWGGLLVKGGNGENSSSWWQELASQRPFSRPNAVRLLCL